MNTELQKSISKSLTYYLRHDMSMPYDSSGWVPISRILEELNNDYNRDITTTDLQTVVQESEKQRFQMDSERIRALYGHNEKLDHISVTSEILEYPQILYHGTPVRNLNSILEVGLQPQSRQKVHLTNDTDLAIKTGRRHCSKSSEKVVLLQIDPDGVKNLSQPNNDIYVGEEVPPKYITEDGRY